MSSQQRHDGHQQPAQTRGRSAEDRENALRKRETPQARRHGLYHSLFDDLEPTERQWVVDVLARQAAAEQQADASGQPLPRPLF